MSDMSQQPDSAADQPTLPPAVAAASGEATLPTTTALDAATLPPNPAPGTDTEPSTAVAVPDYELLGELGRGGMGVVYKARQRGLNRLCALKMILAGGHAGAADLARFKTEAEAIARLQHPNIIQVYEIGTHEGRPFFSLEFCAGGALDRKLNGTPLPPVEAARLVQTLAEAMQAAHDAHVIHRDLKPANVLLTSDGTPKITDFGLAKKLDDVGQTQTGAIMGTPSYMAPEQAEGKKEVGPPADVYALGAILYDCLTGQPPFRAATSFDTILQVVSAEPVPPSQLNHKVPRDLETIALKCLHKEARQRYASAARLADDLRRFLAGEPITARPVGALERGLRWMKRNPVVASLAAAVVILLLVGVAVSSGFALAAHNEATAARNAERHAGEQASRADREARAAAQRADSEAIAKKEALAEKARADEQLARVSTLLYAANLTNVQRMWDAGNFPYARHYLGLCRPALRSWEIDYLFTRSLHNQAQLPIAADYTSSVAFSPDGKHLAVAASALVQVCNATTGATLVKLESADQTAHSVAFSPDGRQVVSAMSGDQVWIWDATTGQKLHALTGHTAWVNAAVFSPNGQTLASASFDGTVRLWHPGTGKLVQTLQGDTATVTDVAFSVDGSRLAAARADSTVELWETQTGKRLRVLKGHQATVRSVAFSPDGRWLASGSQDKTVRLWDTSTGLPVAVLTVHTRSISRVAFGPDGRLVSADEANLFLWDPVTRETTAVLRAEVAGASGLSFSADGRRLAWATGTGQSIGVWDTRNTFTERTIKAPVAHLWSVALSPDGRHVAAVGGKQSLWIWEVATGRVVLEFAHPGLNPAVGQGNAKHIAFNVDGSQIATVSRLGEPTRAWDTTRGHEVPVRTDQFPPTLQRIQPECTPDGKRMARKDGNRVVLWDRQHVEEVFAFDAPADTFSALAFSADGRWLASAGTDGMVRLWDASLGQADIEMPLLSVKSVGVSHDGQLIYFRLPDGWKFAWTSATWTSVKPKESIPDFPAAQEVYSPDRKFSVRIRAGKVYFRNEAKAALVATEMKRRLTEWSNLDLPWHTARAAAAEQQKQWFTAAFHLGRLLEAAPEDATLKRRHDEARARHAAGKPTRP